MRMLQTTSNRTNQSNKTRTSKMSKPIATNNRTNQSNKTRTSKMSKPIAPNNQTNQSTKTHEQHFQRHLRRNKRWKTTTHNNHTDATRKNNNMLTATVNANPSKRNQNACAQFCTTPTHNQRLLFNDGRSPSTNSKENRLRGASAPMHCTGVEGSPTQRR